MYGDKKIESKKKKDPAADRIRTSVSVARQRIVAAEKKYRLMELS